MFHDKSRIRGRNRSDFEPHEISEIRIKLPLAFWNPRFSIELLVQSFREMFPFCYM